MRRFAALDHLPDDADAGGPQELGQLGEVVVLGQRGTQKARWRARVGCPLGAL